MKRFLIMLCALFLASAAIYGFVLQDEKTRCDSKKVDGRT